MRVPLSLSLLGWLPGCLAGSLSLSPPRSLSLSFSLALWLPPSRSLFPSFPPSLPRSLSLSLSLCLSRRLSLFALCLCKLVWLWLWVGVGGCLGVELMHCLHKTPKPQEIATAYNPTLKSCASCLLLPAGDVHLRSELSQSRSFSYVCVRRAGGVRTAVPEGVGSANAREIFFVGASKPLEFTASVSSLYWTTHTCIRFRRVKYIARAGERR